MKYGQINKKIAERKKESKGQDLCKVNLNIIIIFLGFDRRKYNFRQRN